MSTKQCSKCHEIKPTAEFRKATHHIDGLTSHCTSCINLRNRIRYAKTPASKENSRAKATARRQANRSSEQARVRKHQLKRYGLTLEGYQQMLTARNGLCDICKQPEHVTQYGKIKDLAVDHKHGTMHVRGLLCQKCNRAIGGFQDSPALLRAAADYLERHASEG